jgi:hypothetical protein
MRVFVNVCVAAAVIVISTTSADATSRPRTEIRRLDSGGGQVVLYSDSTWSVLSGSSARTGTVRLSAGVVMKSGDVKPLARASVYILSGDIVDTLTTVNARLLADADPSRFEHDFQREHFETYTQHTSALYAYVDACLLSRDYLTREAADPYRGTGGYDAVLRNGCVAAGQEFIKQHLLKELVLGFDGSAVVADLPFGHYYFHLASKLGKEHLLWSVPFDVKAEDQSLILDNGNLSYPY